METERGSWAVFISGSLRSPGSGAGGGRGGEVAARAGMGLVGRLLAAPVFGQAAVSEGWSGQPAG